MITVLDNQIIISQLLQPARWSPAPSSLVFPRVGIHQLACMAGTF
ncbi:hypothetical protein [Pantoea dispersa]|nr:hypothetical protein [Pantoea dispersa]